ncbi:hypothetical protein OSG_eHP40_00275 [environmental Halophage eHP-40]|nr:hypothetical protein OSG_eHP40_00275 [environmental Halophage eHP-40]
MLDLGKAAGEFADENMQSALASNGEVGFGGPSVELDLANDISVTQNTHKLRKRLQAGIYRIRTCHGPRR